MQNLLLRIAILLVISAGMHPASRVSAQEGRVLEIALPMEETAARKLTDQLQQWSESVPNDGERMVVVFKIGGEGGRDSRFEAALALARWLTSPAAANLRTVAWVHDEVAGHAVLPVLACEQLVAHPDTKFGAVSLAVDAQDPAVATFYRAIAERRARIPADAINAMIDNKLELAALGKIDGTWEIASGDRLNELRNNGAAWKELVLSNPGQPTMISGTQLRELRWASHLVSSDEDLAQALSISRWQKADTELKGERKGARVEIRGPTHGRAADRLMRYLSQVSENANTILVEIESAGGDFASSLRMAQDIHSLRKQGIQVIGYVDVEARSDAVLIAAACERLYVGSEAILGGPGEWGVDEAVLTAARAELDDLFSNGSRNMATLLALLDPKYQVAQFTDQKTGRIEYFNPQEFAQRKDVERWTQGDTITTEEGITGDRAVELRFADGQAASLESVAANVGLSEVPELYERHGMVEWVEQVGRKAWLSYLLLFIGMLALAIESGTPGVGVPGLIGATAIGGFIWIQYLNGTAEWLEVMLLIVGIAFLAIELLVLPGFGVFGITGMLMIVAALVLISQTFVFPQNDYQYARTAKGLGGVLIAVLGIAAGFFILQRYLASTPGLKHLMMPEATPDDLEQRERRESLALFDELVGQLGTAVTPLIPAGKIRIGNRTVDVVANGVAVDRGAQVRVLQVLGSRVLVEPVE